MTAKQTPSIQKADVVVVAFITPSSFRWLAFQPIQWFWLESILAIEQGNDALVWN